MRFGDIDRSLPFIPDRFTHLPFTAVYADLTAAQRLRYNQLFALYANELTILFEERFATFYEYLIDAGIFDGSGVAAVRQFIREEAGHAAMFRRLNLAAEPELYRASPFYFLKPPGPVFQAVLRCLRGLLAPSAVLMCSIQEERVTRYAGCYRDQTIEPNFLAAVEAHQCEECEHLILGPQLICRLWQRGSAFRRFVNQVVFRFVLKEFFLAPKRGEVRVLRRLVFEFPELVPLSGRLQQELSGLSRNERFLRSLYSREVIPESIKLCESSKELRAAASVLPGFGVS